MAAEEVGEPDVPEEELAEHDLSISDVCTKYQEAARIANTTLQGVIDQVHDGPVWPGPRFGESLNLRPVHFLGSQCSPGAKVIDVCKFGDQVITSMCAQIYRNKKKMENVKRKQLQVVDVCSYSQ